MEKAPLGAFFVGAADVAQATLVDIPGRIRAVDDAGGLGLSYGVLTMIVARGTVGPRPAFFVFRGRKFRRRGRMQRIGVE